MKNHARPDWKDGAQPATRTIRVLSRDSERLAKPMPHKYVLISGKMRTQDVPGACTPPRRAIS